MYAATVDGQPLTFEVGTLWRGNIVMRDRETGSIWQQATGEALIGPLAGSWLKPLGGELTRWHTWREEHPTTTLAVEPLKQPGGVLPRKVVASVVKSIPPKIVLPGLTPTDERLRPHDEIAGVSFRDETRAYPMSLLRQHQIINDEVGGVSIAIFYDPERDLLGAFRREIDGHPVVLAFDQDTLSNQEGTMRWKQNGEPLSGAGQEQLESVAIARQWWHGWSEFHPRTAIYIASE